MQASRIASSADSAGPVFRIANLNGRVSILTTHLDDGIAIAGNGESAKLLGLGTLREYRESNYFENATSPSATVLMVNARQRTKSQGRLSPGTLAVRDTGTVDPAFVRQMLIDARTDVLPSALTASPANVTDVRMFRVSSANGLNNIVIRP